MALSDAAPFVAAAERPALKSPCSWRCSDATPLVAPDDWTAVTPLGSWQCYDANLLVDAAECSLGWHPALDRHGSARTLATPHLWQPLAVFRSPATPIVAVTGGSLLGSRPHARMLLALPADRSGSACLYPRTRCTLLATAADRYGPGCPCLITFCMLLVPAADLPQSVHAAHVARPADLFPPCMPFVPPADRSRSA